MARCPSCGTSLNTVRQRGGLFYSCPRCNGRAVTLPQIRRVAGDPFATKLLRLINSHPVPGRRPCPFCQQPMRVFHSDNPPVELDACKTCGSVWFDPSEFEAVPEGAVESVHEARLRGYEAFGRYRLEQAQSWSGADEPPDEAWKWIPALFGFPVETNTPAVRALPLITWSLAALIALVSIFAFFHIKTAVNTYGFIPAEALRYGGLTSLTSFFLHAGVFHLVGNLYFLLVFGDNVEDVLGHWKYGFLILAATLVGDFTYWLGNAVSMTPCVGASGGISGIIVFYALAFPKARLGFMFRYFLYFRWFQTPAWGALVLWLIFQGLGYYMERSGLSSVASSAHLGGAAIGFLLWLWWRRNGGGLEKDSGLGG